MGTEFGPTCREDEVLSFKFVCCLLPVLFCARMVAAAGQDCAVFKAPGSRRAKNGPSAPPSQDRNLLYSALRGDERLAGACGACRPCRWHMPCCRCRIRSFSPPRPDPSPGGSPPCRPGLCISVTIHGLV